MHKLTSSLQEWCGQTWIQVNQKPNGQMQAELRSYFESEGDVTKTIPAVVSEDALITQIRLAPLSLPLGTFTMLPTAFYSRLSHTSLQTVQATAAINPGKDGQKQYVVDVASHNRRVVYTFESAAPHKIEKVEDTYRSFGRKLTTTMTRTHTLETKYWQQNRPQDRALLKNIEYLAIRQAARNLSTIG